MRNIIAVFFSLLMCAAPAAAQVHTVRVHCNEDIEQAERLIKSIKDKGGDYTDRIVYAARLLEGIPAAEAADNDSTGTCVLTFHGLDPLGFANTVLALAETSSLSAPTVYDYERKLISYSRRKAEDSGFPSKLFYGSDWIVDNVYRGHLKDMTEYLSAGSFKTKTLDYLTRHRADFPALKDDASYDKVRMTEMGYRSHKIPHLKKQIAGTKTFVELLKNGDIIIMLSPDVDYDLYDVGFVEMIDGEPHLIHISKETGKVTADEYPLERLFKLQNQHFYGFRWLRPEN